MPAWGGGMGRRETAHLTSHASAPSSGMHDGSITTAAVDVIWGTDMSQTVTPAEGVAHVFVAVDHCNSECVVVQRVVRFQALEPVRQGVRRHFGAIGKDVAAGLKLRHDHGPNYMSDDFQDIDASPSFVREPGGNGVAERFIRTLKENLLWVRSFETIEAPGADRIRRLLQYPLAGRPSSPPHTRSGQGRPAADQELGRMNDPAACLITLAQYTAGFGRRKARPRTGPPRRPLCGLRHAGVPCHMPGCHVR